MWLCCFVWMCDQCVGAVDLMVLDRRNDKGYRNLRDSLCSKITGRTKRRRTGRKRMEDLLFRSCQNVQC